MALEAAVPDADEVGPPSGGDSGGGALSDAMEAASTTTPEAQQIARGFLSRVQNDPYEAEQSRISQQTTQEAAKVQDILRNARQRLLARQFPEKASMLFAASAGLNASNPGGNFSGSLGNMSASLHDELTQRAARYAQQDQALEGIDLSSVKEDQGVTAAQQALLNLKRKQDQELGVQSLKVLGKTIANPNAHMQLVQEPVGGGLIQDYVFDPIAAVKKPLGAPHKTNVTSQSVSFTPEMGDLMAELARRNLTLPVGLRSKEQQIAMYDGLLRTGKSIPEIADDIESGKIDLNAMMKESSTAAGIAGRVSVATNEFGTMGPLVLAASKAVPRGSFMPLTKLMQSTDEQLSDPHLRDLKIKITSLLNAYDVLAARGGTDQVKRDHIRSLLLSADSPETLETGVKAFVQEGAAAQAAATKAEHPFKPKSKAPVNTSPPAGVPMTDANGWQLHHDANYNWAYISPDGKQVKEVK